MPTVEGRPLITEITRAGKADHSADHGGHGASAAGRRGDAGEETAAGTAPPVQCERSGHAARGGGCRPVPAAAAASAGGRAPFTRVGRAGQKERCNDVPAMHLASVPFGTLGLFLRTNYC